MSLKTKKRFKNIGKVVAGALFALLLFTNIKVALMDDAEITNGDISLLGVELTLFEATYACVDRSCVYIALYEPAVDYMCASIKGGNCCYDGSR